MFFCSGCGERQSSYLVCTLRFRHPVVMTGLRVWATAFWTRGTEKGLWTTITNQQAQLLISSTSLMINNCGLGFNIVLHHFAVTFDKTVKQGICDYMWEEKKLRLHSAPLGGTLWVAVMN